MGDNPPGHAHPLGRELADQVRPASNFAHKTLGDVGESEWPRVTDHELASWRAVQPNAPAETMRVFNPMESPPAQPGQGDFRKDRRNTKRDQSEPATTSYAGIEGCDKRHLPKCPTERFPALEGLC